MRYSTAIFGFAATAAAAPFISNVETGASLCPAGLYSNPQCCATDVLNAAVLNCAIPSTTPSDITSFISTCSSGGQQAKCCVIPVAGQALLCQDVNPVGGGTPGSPTGGAPGTPTGGAPGGGDASTPCTTSATTVPSATAPAPPVATTTDCGC